MRRVNWGPLVGLLICMASAAFVLALMYGLVRAWGG